MIETVKPGVQNSPLRREQAAATRARIVEAAAQVFASSGYGGTRIQDVAEHAGVAYPTVYKGFRNKPTLLRAAVEAARTGGADGAVERQTWWREQLEEPDPERQLRLVARNARRIYDQAGRLLEVVRAAAVGDEEIAGLWQTIDEERLARSRTIAKSLSAKTELRTGVTQTARTLWALSGPELYVLQVHRGGTGPNRYEAWLADLLVTAIFPAWHGQE